MQKLRSSIVLMMIAIAIILAAGVFLAINAVQNRSNDNAELDLTTSNFLVTVAGETVALQVDPNLRPNIIDTQVIDESPRVEEVPDEQVVAATATPEPPAAPITVEQATAIPAAPAASSATKIIFIDYLVQQGDTLYSISQRMDTSIALMAEHGISQTSLNPGQTIRLPIGNPDFCAGRGRPYAIGEGDTVYNLSQRFNTTTQNLQSLNGLDANFSIKIADIICVP